MEILSFTLYLIIFLISSAFLLYLKRNETPKPRKSLRLPPGSMGLPWIGETLQLYSQDPNIFFSEKQRRYGEIFKTNILGCPCVMLASAAAARFVLVTNAHLFRPTYPKSKETMIGPAALFFHQGNYHSNIRKLVQNSLCLGSLRNLVPHIETAAISAAESWAAAGHVINTFLEMKKFSFDVGILAVFGKLESDYSEKLKENYCILDKGYNSFPTRLPGTAYSKALSARKKLREILGEIIMERREKRVTERDLVGHLLSFRDENGGILSEDQIADNIIGVLFAAQDTTASVLTWILKYLHDNLKLFEAVRAEQMEIHRRNDDGKMPLSWAQIKDMPLTHRVVLESLRMASIISFTFREAVVDVEYKGFLIPKGWKVMPLFRNIHHSPDYFPNPQIFDPSRFEVSPRPNTFMPFGNGVHSCPGNELAKLEILVLLHHLITKFRWEVVGSQSGVQYGPFPVPVNGLPARFFKQGTTHQ
ncbi:abscisic acid 8'-hydroxylase 4-like [Cucurbita pepo subsp. pepo]|uniref:abscisic acid 8'-hydroxylase 4-like n=1 Tax=Cucurbita pepo subsp. pepo TaxID=3664 RepID=UPI000C9DA0AD|nr:abscisic acid 8'-hydroxylase 4-like [Cucurbita pepo subsp. pepo]